MSIIICHAPISSYFLGRGYFLFCGLHLRLWFVYRIVHCSKLRLVSLFWQFVAYTALSSSQSFSSQIAFVIHSFSLLLIFSELVAISLICSDKPHECILLVLSTFDQLDFDSPCFSCLVSSDLIGPLVLFVKSICFTPYSLLVSWTFFSHFDFV